jgi:hypothetical protein
VTQNTTDYCLLTLVIKCGLLGQLSTERGLYYLVLAQENIKIQNLKSRSNWMHITFVLLWSQCHKSGTICSWKKRENWEDCFCNYGTMLSSWWKIPLWWILQWIIVIGLLALWQGSTKEEHCSFQLWWGECGHGIWRQPKDPAKHLVPLRLSVTNKYSVSVQASSRLYSEQTTPLTREWLSISVFSSY